MSPDAVPVEFLVITGLSGAGRRTAAHTLEDHSWYVVDNLPPELLPHLLQVVRERRFDKVAVVVDVRTGSAFERLPVVFAELERTGVVPRILFLEASDEAIVRRQESVRRPLPLQGGDRLLDGIRRERTSLAELRGLADIVIDTSDLNIRELSRRVAELLVVPTKQLQFTVMSFGFKNGVPVDADVVLDVRFLPNPFWVPELRDRTGLEPEVAEYVLSQPSLPAFLEAAERLVEAAVPGYQQEGKRHVTVGIGCTGGKHRSTAVGVELAARLRDRGLEVNVVHRDLGLE
ncbi:MAG: RNase adapter RapZ [Propionicimonas sp.]|nr:RNase adapter RapZ [Propionicimonas sp.]